MYRYCYYLRSTYTHNFKFEERCVCQCIVLITCYANNNCRAFPLRERKPYSCCSISRSKHLTTMRASAYLAGSTATLRCPALFPALSPSPLPLLVSPKTLLKDPAGLAILWGARKKVWEVYSLGGTHYSICMCVLHTL